MFESTLGAQGLHEGEKRYGTLSAALLAHLGIVVTIVAVGAVIVPPVITPEPRRIVVPILTQIPLGDLVPKPTESRPKKGSDAAKPVKAITAPPVLPVTVPRSTPDFVPTTASDDTASDFDGPGHGGLGDGSDVGGPLDDGDGRSGGPGTGSDPQYVTGEMKRPVLLVRVEPQYPEAARQARLQGRVTVQAVIGEDGAIESAEVLASKNPLFNAAAVDAVRKWRYSPALMNGKPVRVYFTVVVDFVLR